MRNLCSKCPHYYEQHGYECDDVDWGCTVYGRDFKDCPSFNDGEGLADFEEWGCNEKQIRIDYTRNKLKRKSRALCKIGEAKERRFYKKIYSVLPKEDEGYKAYFNGEFRGFYTRDYRQNMKGGHTHNHVKNAHERMRRCRICDKPITKYEGFKAPWYGHICLDCYFQECMEEAYMCGIPFGWKRSDNFYRSFIRRARKK